MTTKYDGYDVQAVGPGRVVVAGSFAPAGTGAVTDVKGTGFSVARTSTGLFTITLDKVYSELLAATPGLQLAAGDDKTLQFGTYVAASGTLELRVWDFSAAAVADISADANNRVNFVLVLRNTNLPY